MYLNDNKNDESEGTDFILPTKSQQNKKNLNFGVPKLDLTKAQKIQELIFQNMIEHDESLDNYNHFNQGLEMHKQIKYYYFIFSF